ARDDLEASRRHLLRCQYSPHTQQKACRQLAAVCRRQGDEAGAARFLERARSLPADRPLPDPYLSASPAAQAGKPGRFHYLDRLEAQQRYRDAILLLQEMLQEGPDYRAYVGLGKNLAQLGRFPEADEALRAAVRLEPDSVQAYYLLSKVAW